MPSDVDYGCADRAAHRGRTEAEQVPPGHPGTGLPVSGVTPADVAMLLVHLEKAGRR